MFISGFSHIIGYLATTVSVVFCCFLLANILYLPTTLFVIHCYTAKFTYYSTLYILSAMFISITFLTIDITIVVSVYFSFALNITFTFYYYFFCFCCGSFYLGFIFTINHICFGLFHIYLRQCLFLLLITYL